MSVHTLQREFQMKHDTSPAEKRPSLNRFAICENTSSVLGKNVLYIDCLLNFSSFSFIKLQVIMLPYVTPNSKIVFLWQKGIVGSFDGKHVEKVFCGLNELNIEPKNPKLKYVSLRCSRFIKERRTKRNNFT